jgi:type IV secretory pathway VirB10-like protein
MAKRAKSKPAQKLKTYQTSLGFYDQAIAAPSMKAALEAWGASSNLFHQGAAKETDDPDIVAATLAKPGIVLRRPVGSDGPFTESAELPTDLAEDDARPKRKSGKRQAKTANKTAKKSAKTPSRKLDDQAARKAAAAFEKEERRREAARRKAHAKQRARRDKAVAAAEAALDKARREHEAKAEEIEAARAALDDRTEAEQTRWDKQRMKLQEALRRARE